MDAMECAEVRQEVSSDTVSVMLPSIGCAALPKPRSNISLIAALLTPAPRVTAVSASAVPTLPVRPFSHRASRDATTRPSGFADWSVVALGPLIVLVRCLTLGCWGFLG
jgi:hypothetical protein